MCLCVTKGTDDFTMPHVNIHALPVTKEQSAFLKASTREQSCSILWFAHRVGRITASNFKAIDVTNSCMPFQSLISRLFYSREPQFFLLQLQGTV